MKNHWLQKKDDLTSLQQLAGACDNLDIFYSMMYVQNETIYFWCLVKDCVEFSPLEHTPVLPQTITGRVYCDSQLIQTFSTKEDGSFVLNKIYTPANYIEHGTINHITGEISTTWNFVPPNNKTKLVISYEYKMGF